MLKAIALGVALTATMTTGASAVSITAAFDSCGDDIDCTEIFYWLGETMYLYEASAVEAVGIQAEACMKADIAAWSEAIETTCMGNACVKTAYFDRLAVLDPLQPDMYTVKGELPEVASLVAVLGPETAEATTEPGKPLSVSGELVRASQHAEHMGLALDAGAAAEHIIVFDMDISNQPGHHTLISLIESADGDWFLVRGTAEKAPDGVPNFNPNHCRFVYRLP